MSRSCKKGHLKQLYEVYKKEMTVTYKFPSYEGNQEYQNYYEYDVPYSDLMDFIISTYSTDEIISLYIEEIYNKSAEERDIMYDQFSLKSATEVKDFLHEVPDIDWVIEELIDTIPEYFEDEVKEYFEEDALFEFENTEDRAEMEDEWMSDYYKSRL